MLIAISSVLQDVDAF